jgi:hypothetical protein
MRQVLNTLVKVFQQPRFGPIFVQKNKIVCGVHLKHYSPVIQPPCLPSKWNLYPKIQF